MIYGLCSESPFAMHLFVFSLTFCRSRFRKRLEIDNKTVLDMQ
jgi:hypothetical protein